MINIQQAVRKYLELATYEKQNFIKSMNLDITDYIYINTDHLVLHAADMYFFNYIKTNNLEEKFITFIEQFKL